MKLNVKTVLLVLVFVSPTACGCGGEYPIISSVKDDGTKIGLVVPDSAIKAAPSWKPEDGEPPLSISAARDAVLEWSKTKYSRYDSVKISEISLKSTGGCSRSDHWLYVFDLRPVIDGSALWGTGNWAAVLMDGTVTGTKEME